MLGAAALAPSILSRRVLAKPVFDSYPFSMGIASGDPLPDGIVLWTRLAPKPLEGGGMPMNIVEVDWEMARDNRFQSVVQNGTTLARPELGHSVRVEVAGLHCLYGDAGRDARRLQDLRKGECARSSGDDRRFADRACRKTGQQHRLIYFFISLWRVAIRPVSPPNSGAVAGGVFGFWTIG
jgi:hypothetical protein